MIFPSKLLFRNTVGIFGFIILSTVDEIIICQVFISSMVCHEIFKILRQDSIFVNEFEFGFVSSLRLYDYISNYDSLLSIK